MAVLADRLAAALVHREPGWRLPRRSALARRYNVSLTEIDAALGDPARDKSMKPGQLMNEMGLKSGMTVADVGTGIGFMLLDGDRVMLCTDGLNDMVRDEEIAKALDQHASSSDACATPSRICSERRCLPSRAMPPSSCWTNAPPRSPS